MYIKLEIKINIQREQLPPFLSIDLLIHDYVRIIMVISIVTSPGLTHSLIQSTCYELDVLTR